MSRVRKVTQKPFKEMDTEQSVVEKQSLDTALSMEAAHSMEENNSLGVDESCQKIRDTSRQAEERYLSQTLDVIRNNLENYGEQVHKMRKDIDEMLAHYHDDNPELNLLLNNTITLHDHMKRALERNEKALNKPYFGRIIFQDETVNMEDGHSVAQ